LHLYDEALQRVNESLNLCAEPLQCVNVTLYLYNEALQRVDGSLNLYDESLQV